MTNQKSSSLRKEMSRVEFVRLYGVIVKANFDYEAYNGMWKERPIIYSNEFLGICSMALYDDMMSNLIKLFVEHKGSLTFWNVNSWKKSRVKEILEESELSIKELRDFSMRLRKIRNKTHFHIDKHEGIDSNKIWKEVNLNYFKTAKIIQATNSIFETLFKETYSNQLPYLQYNGIDATKIIRKIKGEMNEIKNFDLK